MAISERIRYIRNLRGMSQKMLGIRVGFNEKNAGVRIAQYESGIRNPKECLINTLAEALDISPSKEEYDARRYTYPAFKSGRKFGK